MLLPLVLTTKANERVSWGHNPGNLLKCSCFRRCLWSVKSFDIQSFLLCSMTTALLSSPALLLLMVTWIHPLQSYNLLQMFSVYSLHTFFSIIFNSCWDFIRTVCALLIILFSSMIFMETFSSCCVRAADDWNL